MSKRHIKNLGLFFAMSVVMILPQINQHAMILGVDSLFHMNRFYDAAMQIKEHNLQYFISMYGYFGSGRIVNALYGPGIAYFNGALLLIVGSWFKYQLLSDLFVSMLAAISMYYLVNRAKITPSLQPWLVILYMTSNGIVTWLTDQQFLGWGTAILPIGIAVIVRLLRDDKPVNILEMAFSVAIMVQMHMLTAVIYVAILAVVFLIRMIQSPNRWSMLRNASLSAVFAIGLTANIWLGMLEVFGSNHILQPALFVPLDNILLLTSSTGRHLSFLLKLIFALQIGAVGFFFGKISRINRYMTIIGGVLLLLTTPLVPWNWLFNHIHGLSTIQFPFRFLPFATAFLIVGMGLTLTQLISYFDLHKTSKWPVIRYVQFPIILMAAISVLNAADQLYVATQPWTTGDVVRSRANVTQDVSNEELKESFSNAYPLDSSLDSVWKSTSDYLPLPSGKLPEHPYYTYSVEIGNPRHAFTRTIRNGKMYITWQQKKAGWQAVNVVKYVHTQLVLNKQLLSDKDIKLSEIGAVRVYGQAGKNVLQVQYRPQSFMRWGFIILVISWISWIGLIIYHNRKK